MLILQGKYPCPKFKGINENAIGIFIWGEHPCVQIMMTNISAYARDYGGIM